MADKYKKFELILKRLREEGPDVDTLGDDDTEDDEEQPDKRMAWKRGRKPTIITGGS